MNFDILQDITPDGKKRPWVKHRKAVVRLALPYEFVNPDKAQRLRNCSTIVTREVYADEKIKDIAMFCHVRLCPICTWRRSLKVEAQMFQIMAAIKADKPHAYLFLTLTQKNCQPQELDQALTNILCAFRKMTRKVAWKNAVKGFFRTLEITHNLTDDTYHPHIHAVLAVDFRYFKDQNYLSQEKWTQLWMDSLEIPYTPIVDVRKVKGDTASAVAEVAKYSVKTQDYIIPDDWDMTVSTVRLLDSVLHKRRFVAYGGLFKQYYKKLELSNPDDPEEDPIEEEPLSRTHYAWCDVYQQYRKINLSDPGPENV